MQASIPSIVGQMIVFGAFIWFTMKFVWPPITKAMEERRQKIADGLAAAEKGARALQDASAKSEEELKVARTQAQDILANANKQAAQIVEQAKVTAQEEGARIVAKAHEDVEREVAHAREELRKRVGELAVVGAAKILKREIDTKAHADVLNDLAARV
ncbi:MAG: F0F1 ATP synthase subunit B [Sinimarinibacterium flocculans]|uniref:ATP synthase subunit b n=1 Tax=Sinimarinibacterium flocculans TaxID=985250 RepID=A0A318E6Q7_9GAMM|nr:F0F1 ATP synthase subunit B [Sinimarinibacterium flocculans]MEC9364545.1 F0F1 ATP synthase subunit B [Pseudomonadota bacterium]PXV66461.1 F-type H+-transporting ATPase subunit b [Sinimarinibacterium flocculans]